MSQQKTRTIRAQRVGRTNRKAMMVPPQHGAWAFLGLPILLGAAVAGLSWLTALLAIGFVVAYPASYFAIAVLRYPRPQLYRQGLLAWGIPGVAIACGVLIARPWMLWVGIAYAIAFAVNVGFAKAHNERSLINDAVFIVECIAITPIIWACSASAGGLVPPSLATAPSAVWTLTAMSALALVGSTLHVRSLIREKRNPVFRRLSQTFAMVSLLVALVLAIPYGTTAVIAMTGAFGYLAVRSFVVGIRPLRPGLIGVFELVGFIATFGAGVAVSLA